MKVLSWIVALSATALAAPNATIELGGQARDAIGVESCVQDGTCCPEQRSLCVYGPTPQNHQMDYYWRGPGSCNTGGPPING